MRFEKEIRSAIDAAREAGQLIRDDYRSFVSIPDAPADITTETDRRAQELILRSLQKIFPDDSYCAEETTPSLLQSNQAGTRQWIVDPIDGTRGFAKKNGEFSVMIGLVADGEVVVGVVYEPVLDRLTYAYLGGGCWVSSCGSKPSRVEASKRTHLNESTLVQSHSKTRSEMVESIEPARIIETYSAGIKLALVARGEAELYVNTYQAFHDWDICAGHVLVTEAGGQVTTLRGAKISYGGPDHVQNGGLLASNRLVHPEALRLLERTGGT